MENVKHSSNEDASMYILRLLSRFTDHFLIFYQQKQPPWCSVKKTVFKNFAMFIEKQLCRRESYFKKIAGLQCVT